MPLRKILNRLGSRAKAGGGLRTGPRVLLYHRVYSPERDPQLLCVSPENFRLQMRWLGSHCTVLALAEMVDARFDLPSNAVAVTFDDGYFDNCVYAKPILEENSVHATVFVSSGFVDNGREMWWDEAEQIFLKGTDPEWNVTLPTTDDAQAGYKVACSQLKFLAPPERDVLLDSLASERGGTCRLRDSHRGVSHSELVGLSESEFVDIGGHTVNHPSLSSLQTASQRAEIERDKASLETVTGSQLSSFAYPFGTATEFDETTRSIVSDTGYSIACANIPGIVEHATDRLAIPRVIVRNWDERAFAARMRDWLGPQ